MKRKWSKALGGYTYDGVKLTECQCNTSAGGCKCGKLADDQTAELLRQQNLEDNK